LQAWFPVPFGVTNFGVLPSWDWVKAGRIWSRPNPITFEWFFSLTQSTGLHCVWFAWFTEVFDEVLQIPFTFGFRVYSLKWGTFPMFCWWIMGVIFKGFMK